MKTYKRFMEIVEAIMTIFALIVAFDRVVKMLLQKMGHQE